MAVETVGLLEAELGAVQGEAGGEEQGEQESGHHVSGGWGVRGLRRMNTISEQVYCSCQRFIDKINTLLGMILQDYINSVLQLRGCS